MKRFISLIIRSAIIAVIILAGLFYFVNYQTEGETAYITQKCPVYNLSDLTDQIDTLSIGDSVESLVYYGDANKIRYTDDDGEVIVGFINEKFLNYYSFPKSSNQSVIISVSSQTEFKNFISILNSLTDEDFSLIGVYLDFSLLSSYNSYGNLYKIQEFCENQLIPWGDISNLNQDSYNNYISDKVDSEFENVSYTAKLLPYVFRLYNEDYIDSSYELDNCIIYTSSGEERVGYKSWTTTLSSSFLRNSEILKESYAYTFYKEDDIELSFVSDDWFYDIESAYNKIEDATHD